MKAREAHDDDDDGGKMDRMVGVMVVAAVVPAVTQPPRMIDESIMSLYNRYAIDWLWSSPT